MAVNSKYNISIKETLKNWVEKLNTVINLPTVDGSFQQLGSSGRVVSISSGFARNHTDLTEFPAKEIQVPKAADGFIGADFSSYELEFYNRGNVPRDNFIPFFVVKANNSGITEFTDARTWATGLDASNFATKEQAELASSAVQPDDISEVARTGDFNDLLNAPTSQFSGNYDELSNKPDLFDGDYQSLTNKPNLFDGDYQSLTNTPNFATVAITGSYDDLANQPQLFSGSFNDLTDVPALSTVSATGSYNDLENLPTLGSIASENIEDFATSEQGQLADSALQSEDVSRIATSGSYNDLGDLPNFSSVATSGSYNDLNDTPELGTAASSDSSEFVSASEWEGAIPTIPITLAEFNSLSTEERENPSVQYLVEDT